MKQLIIGLETDLADMIDHYFVKTIKDEKVIYADEWLQAKDIADRFNTKFRYSTRELENINDKNEKIQDFDEVITFINGHIYVYFKGKDY